MSLPLRHALENVSSLDRVLEDLLVRFIINCPPEDLSSVERELFHFEEASWFYTDFIKLMNQNLPTLKIKSLSQLIIKICPLIWKWDIKADEALAKFSKYKKTIPVRGAAIFNEDLNKILLVKGTESDSWSFPRGKISKDEDDVDCCIREVKEEIGFDLTDYIDEDQFIERNISAKNYKIYLIKNVPEEFMFQPQVRNEIEKIKWFEFKTVNKNIYKSNNSFKYYLINSMIRPISMWVRHQKQVKNEDQLKQYAEEQLKLLLGIAKEEQIDPGRDLLNMLHSAVQSSENVMNQTDARILPAISNQPQEQQNMANGLVANRGNVGHLPNVQPNPMLQFMPPPLPQQPQQPQSAFRAMGFQPFAPFAFSNSSIPATMPQHFLGQPVQMPGYPMSQMPVSNSTTVELQQHNETNLSNVPSTPNIQSLSKPSLITVEGNHMKSNELLSLLKNPRKTVSHLSLQSSPSSSSVDAKPKVRILQRGENLSSTTNNDDNTSILKVLRGENKSPLSHPVSKTRENESHALLNLLKKPTGNQDEIQNQQPNISFSLPHEDAIDQRLDKTRATNVDEEVFEDSSLEEDEPDSLTPSLSLHPNENTFNKMHHIEPLQTYHNETEDTEDVYSNFEDSTDSENEGEEFRSAYENVPSESKSEFEGEQLEVLLEDENLSNESLPDSILQKNIFTDGEVPHQDRKSESAQSVNSLQVNESGVNSPNNGVTGRPKIKILKRGEKLEDVAKSPLSPRTVNIATSDNNDVSLHETAEPLKSPLDQSSQDLLSILKNRTPVPELPASGVRKTSLQKSEETKNELLDLLKKNAQIVPEYEIPSNEESHSHQLLATLNEPTSSYHKDTSSPSYQNNALNGTVFVASNNTVPMLPPTTDASSNSPNEELLKMLHRNSNRSSQTQTTSPMFTPSAMQSSHLMTQGTPQHAPLGNSDATSLLDMLKNSKKAPGSQPMSSNIDASSQLLNILHRK